MSSKCNWMCATSLGWRHLVNAYIPFVSKRVHVWQVKLCDPLLTRAISERIRGVYIVIYFILLH